MTAEKVRAINADRLGKWVEFCSDRHSTAVALISVGHDEASGTITVCSVEDLEDDMLTAFLSFAQIEVRKRRHKRI